MRNKTKNREFTQHNANWCVTINIPEYTEMHLFNVSIDKTVYFCLFLFSVGVRCDVSFYKYVCTHDSRQTCVNVLWQDIRVHKGTHTVRTYYILIQIDIDFCTCWMLLFLTFLFFFVSFYLFAIEWRNRLTVSTIRWCMWLNLIILSFRFDGFALVEGTTASGLALYCLLLLFLPLQIRPHILWCIRQQDAAATIHSPLETIDVEIEWTALINLFMGLNGLLALVSNFILSPSHPHIHTTTHIALQLIENKQKTRKEKKQTNNVNRNEWLVIWDNEQLFLHFHGNAQSVCFTFGSVRRWSLGGEVNEAGIASIYLTKSIHEAFRELFANKYSRNEEHFPWMNNVTTEKIRQCCMAGENT